MTRRTGVSDCAGVSLLLLACASAAEAQAARRCEELPNPLYLQVGDTQEPLMKKLGRALRDEAEPLSLVYVTSGSCTNVEAMYRGVKISKNALYVPSEAESASWSSKDPALPCTVPDGGHTVDVANSALFVSSCDPAEPPSGIKLFQGPVQGYGFVVPEHSTERAVTAEEAYFAFGFGDESELAPWNDESEMFIRTVTKSTLLTLAAVIQVPADRWKGTRYDKSSEVLSALVAAPNPESAIGILGIELYDQNRERTNVLAYRAYGQRYAYYPDSTSTAFDKRNVRDGHYAPWSPTVWLTKVDANGTPVDARAERLIRLILGQESAPPPSFEPLDVVIDVGLVPECAMRVTRSYEGGELSHYTPVEPCGCYFEARVEKKTPAGCVVCDDGAPCAQGVCRHGYCEEH